MWGESTEVCAEGGWYSSKNWKQIRSHKITGHNAGFCSALLIREIDLAFVLDYKELFVSWQLLRLKNVPQPQTIRPAELWPLAEQQDGLVWLCRCHSAVRLLGNQWTVANIRTLCQPAPEHKSATKLTCNAWKTEVTRFQEALEKIFAEPQRENAFHPIQLKPHIYIDRGIKMSDTLPIFQLCWIYFHFIALNKWSPTNQQEFRLLPTC